MLTATDASPNPDHAWKQLSMVNDWIRHSDAKAAATLAASGVMATVTFNLISRLDSRSCCTEAAVVVSVGLLIASVLFCGLTLAPRTRDKNGRSGPPSPIYFGSVAANFTRDSYRGELRTLAADPARLVDTLADQVHVNSGIATKKALWAGWAIRSALTAALAVGVLAVCIAAQAA